MEEHLSSVRPRLQYDRTSSGGSDGFEMTWLAPAQSEEYGESSSQYSSPSTRWQDESASLMQDTARRGQRDSFCYNRLDNPTPLSTSSSLKKPSFISTFNPLTTSGRSRIRKAILRSGPAYEHPQLQTTGDQAEPGKEKRGWRFGTLVSCYAVAACLLLELVLLTYALVINRPRNGLGMLYDGHCEKVKRLSILLLLPLNIIGTVLISTSNYVMQAVSAPTRQEVDRSHAGGGFRNIGMPTSYDMLWSRPYKSTLWWILAITTVPIHLFLNSSIFSTLETNNYGIMIVSSDFEQDETWKLCNTTTFGTRASTFVCGMYQQLTNRHVPTSNITSLSPQECISLYGNDLQSVASNVVLVTQNSSNSYSILENMPSQDIILQHNPRGLGVNRSYDPAAGYVELTFNGYGVDYTWSATSGLFTLPDDPIWKITSLRSVFNAFDYRMCSLAPETYYNWNSTGMKRAWQWNPSTWICPTNNVLDGDDCNAGAIIENLSDWKVTPKEIPIDSCYSVAAVEHCTLRYSLTILIIVISCDSLKLLAMFLVLKMPGNPLTTLGDAITSFMENPDPTTAGRCLMNDADMRRKSRLFGLVAARPYENQVLPKLGMTWSEVVAPRPVMWRSRSRRWWSIPSTKRWGALCSMLFGLLACSAVVFTWGLEDLTALGVSRIWDHGFSGPDPNSIFTNQAFQGESPTIIFQDTLTLNLPQLWFSIFYFTYNGILTTMHTGNEWSQFTKRRKALRVSIPRMEQRSTYWLQLPFSYIIPLIITSGVLHWLVGRSLFLVKIDVYGFDGQREAWRDISACGYSSLAILLVMVLLCLMALALGLVGRRRLQPGMSAVGTSSGAISAACHPLDVDRTHNAAFRPLMWGVVKEPNGSEPGHCSFTTMEVTGPVDGMYYM